MPFKSAAQKHIEDLQAQLLERDRQLAELMNFSLLTQIATATGAGGMSEAEGEKLRRNVVKSIEELFSIGVYTSEMENSRPPAPSQIPVQRMKLLGHVRPREVDADPGTDDGSEDLSAELGEPRDE